MRIAIMGSGGMGGFLGAKLALVGHNVTFIARGAHKNAINSNGLKLLSQDGDIHIYPAQAYENTDNIAPVDLILFCVKLYDTETAARSCLPLMTKDSFILTLQNGVESVDLISNIVGKGRTLGGSIYVSANIKSPGIITHSGGNNTIHFAEFDHKPSHRIEILENILAEAGLNPVHAKNMDVMLWSKFVVLSANAALGTLTNLGAVSLCHNPDTKELFKQAMYEVFNLAQAMDIILPTDIIDKNLAMIASLNEKSDLISSQCLDFRAGKKLELEWIQGTIHRLGQKHAIKTPINSTAYVALKRFSEGTN
ncbi:MAG: 2-dehydropantoate 2-reductase [Emcibacter sp.]|nr:2-dehydropantoate 2-reductase [Emcibacter sp.]